MDCRGLADPKNKPFGRVLPLEIQVKIMFWVHCFYTMDKRKKVVQEFKGLPKCDLTLLPQHLGEGRWWTQVMVRLHTLRGSYCHHCHRLVDHRLSVRENFFLENGRTIRLERFVCFTDWHDGGIGTPTPSPPLDNLMNEGITFVIRKFQCRLTDTPVGQRAVMIGRRKSPYDTIDKVMKRLDLIMNVMEAMNFIPVDVH